MAGDLVFAGVILNTDIKELNDSKKLSAKKREELFEIIVKNSKYHIVKHSAKQIDDIGLSKCIQNSLLEIMKNIKADSYLFDGNSNFGIDNLKTMVKADAKIPEVSAASILAKVTRDKSMIEASNLYPKYQFEKHKGYITKKHIELVKKFGYCEIHRKSYKVKALSDI